MQAPTRHAVTSPQFSVISGVYEVCITVTGQDLQLQPRKPVREPPNVFDIVQTPHDPSHNHTRPRHRVKKSRIPVPSTPIDTIEINERDTTPLRQVQRTRFSEATENKVLPLDVTRDPGKRPGRPFRGQRVTVERSEEM